MKKFYIAKFILIAVLAIFLSPNFLFAQVAPAELEGEALKSWLRTNYFDGKHHALGYSTARMYMYNYIDNHNNKLTCVYSGLEVSWTYGGTGTNPMPINCEHTVPQSFFGSADPMVSDIHHLFPTYSNWNSTRSNYPFTDIPDTQTSSWMILDQNSTAIPSTNINGYSEFANNTFEPREVHKGNLARAVFYFYTMYPTQAGNMSSVADMNMLYQWHLSDPVDAAEIARNNGVEQYQGNRNPFIDYPELVAKAWGFASSGNTAPNIPGNIALTSSLTNISLTWSDQTSETGYLVFRSTDNVNFTQIANLAANTTNYTDNSVIASTVYYYNIKAYNTYGTSGASVTVSGQLSSATAPMAPANFALNLGQNTMALSWSDVSSETGYKIYRSTDNVNFSEIASLNANITTYTDASAVAGTVYYYYATAFNTYGTSPASSTVSGTVQASTATVNNLFISEYVEGSSNNKALEIANFTGAAVNLSNFNIKKQTNGAGAWSTGYALSGTLANGSVFVLTHSSASAAILAKANATYSGSEVQFNGNDAVGLFQGTTLIDMVGVLNNTANFAADVTLVRKPDVTVPAATYNAADWNVFAIDNISNLGTHTIATGGGTPVCDIPAGLTASSVTETSANAAWSAANGAVSYELKYQTTGAATWLSTTTANLNTVLASLTAGSNYSFKVKSVCATVSSDFSAVSNFTTLCNAPASISASAITETSANAAWSAANGAISYELQYQTTGAASWLSVSTSNLNAALTGLTANTDYSMKVKAVCVSASSAFTAITAFKTLAVVVPQPTYCTAVGGSTVYEWIDYMEIGTIKNTSGAAKYSNFSNLSTNLTPGSSTTIYFSAGFKSTLYKEYWTIWVDFNSDGDFTDAGETIKQGTTTGAGNYSATLAIPTGTSLGTKRLRVQMNDTKYYSACSTFKYGEVEDYSINVVATALKSGEVSNTIANELETDLESTNPMLYPTLVENEFYFDNISNINYVKIYSVAGKLMLSEYNYSHGMNVSELKTGAYLVEVSNGDKVYNFKMVKQ
ncbi:MAG TPA: hypothetical protein DCQ31_06775 [Bacteroidales bacterium]|nr:hypothetical protein [Bacteroidales bacterium]